MGPRSAWMLLAPTVLFAAPPEGERPDNLWLRESSWGDLHLNAGAMVLNLPVYPGSEQIRSTPFPIFNGDYGKRLVFGASRFGVGGGAGWNIVRSGAFTWSLGADITAPRRESYARALAGMGDRPYGIFLASGVTWQKGPLESVIAVRHSFRDGAGSGAVVRSTLYLPLGHRWLLEARLMASAFDHPQMKYEFGVDPDQAARRRALIDAGDPRLRPGDGRAFDPPGGWALVQSSLAVGYAVDAHWRLGLTVLHQDVQGVARRSPLVLQPGGWGSVIGFSYQL